DRIRAGFGGDVEHIAPVHHASSGECLPKRTRARGDEPGHLLRVGNLLRSRPANMLEDAHGPLATDRRSEVLGVVAANQSSEVWSEFADFDLCVGRAIAPYEIEKERDANVVDIL